MAITRTQIAKQLLEQGGRVGLRFGSEGYQGGKTDQGGAGKGTGPERGGGNSGNRFTEFTKENLNPQVDTVTEKFTGRSNLFGGANRFGYTELRPDGSLKPGYGGRIFGGLLSALTGIPIVGGSIGNMYDKGKGFFTPKTKDMSEFNKLGLLTEENDDTTTGEIDTTTGNIQDGFLENAQAKVVGLALAQKQNLEKKKRMEDFGGPTFTEEDQKTLDKLNEMDASEETFYQPVQTVADGGRIGAQEGGIMPRLNQLGSGVSSAEQTLQEINQRLESAESNLGGGGVGQDVTGNNPMEIALPSVQPGSNNSFFGRPILELQGQPMKIDPPSFARPGNIPGTDAPYSSLRGSLNQFSSGIDQLNVTPPQTPVAMQQPLSGIPAASYANGGNVVGGEYDFESARQMYGLGKLVKKVTRGVKKIAKSPIGKAALLYTGLGGLGSVAGGGTFFGNFANPMSQLGGIKSIFSGSGLTNISKAGRSLFGTMEAVRPDQDVFKKNFLGKALTSPGGIITAASMLPLLGIGTGEESEEEAQAILDNSGIDIEALRANPQLARRFRAEGGSMNEPVAKKTMPLLDMDGKEMDLRAEGGFVPIGRMEKADDVPARLSKNEFVFTADAVRNAGDGDVDKGAEVMYNMMKNLESGGDVSEESQGLEGARKMFQTSQRLEEVL